MNHITQAYLFVSCI